MKESEARVRPPYSVLLVSDPSQRVDVPSTLGTALVAATPSCVAVGTRAETDGLTTIRLAAAFDHPDGDLVFSGRLATPGHRVSISDAEGVELLAMEVSADVTDLSIWANDPAEPDVISVAAT